MDGGKDSVGSFGFVIDTVIGYEERLAWISIYCTNFFSDMYLPGVCIYFGLEYGVLGLGFFSSSFAFRIEGLGDGRRVVHYQLLFLLTLFISRHWLTP